MNSVQEIWHPMHATPAALLKTAAHVCPFGDTAAHRVIAQFAAKRGVAAGHQPIKVHAADATYAIFHNADRYDIYIAGPTDIILQRCELSENEREKALLEARRMINGGVHVMSLAHGQVARLPTSLRNIVGLSFCGHISTI